MKPSEANTPIACNPFALNDRARYQTLSTLLKTAISDRSELPDGYVYVLDGEQIGIAELGEWITLERQCCPFLDFGLTISNHTDSWRLALTGPDGSKRLLEREFGRAALNGLE